MWTELKLWLVTKLLDDSWILIDSEYSEQIQGHLARLKGVLGTQYKSRLEASELSQVHYQVAQLEQQLRRVTHGTTPRHQEEDIPPWEI